MLNIVLFGPPGAGKGTQADYIMARYNLVHLSTGDLLRSEIVAGTRAGLKAKKLMDEGMLVPDEIVISMIDSKIKSNASASGFIFDGFPRTRQQATALDNLLHENKTSVTLTLSLEVNEEELLKRLLKRGVMSGRADDANETIIRNRIKQYFTNTEPLKQYYEEQDKLFRVDGVGKVDDITTVLFELINQQLSATKTM